MLEWPSDVWVFRGRYVVRHRELAGDERAMRSVCGYLMYIYVVVVYVCVYASETGGSATCSRQVMTGR